MLLVLVVTSFQSFGQNDDCETTLLRANEEFALGHFYQIPAMLSNCLSQFSAEQRQRAYLLLTQTYLLLDDPIGARSSYLKVLEANPEFVADENLHPIDVVYLSKKFTASPIFSLYARFGLNTAPVTVLKTASTLGEREVSYRYQVRLGYQASVGVLYHFRPSFSLMAEVDYNFSTYRKTSGKFFNGLATNYGDFNQLTERMTWIGIPLGLRYSWEKGKFRPYAYGGYGLYTLIGSKGSLVFSNQQLEVDPVTGEQRVSTTSSEESADFSFRKRREQFHHTIFLGGGLKYKYKLNYFFADVRFAFGLRNVVKQDNVYSDNNQDPLSNDYISSFEPTSAFANGDDLFRVNNIQLSFGYIRPLYKPRELKKARTKSVFKRIKKSGNEQN